MSSLYQTVQRGRVISHQDGEQKTGGSFGFCSFRRLEFRECPGKGTVSQLRRRADVVGGTRPSSRHVRGCFKRDFEFGLVGSPEWS